jgi:hypothetical protein
MRKPENFIYASYKVQFPLIIKIKFTRLRSVVTPNAKFYPHPFSSFGDETQGGT